LDAQGREAKGRVGRHVEHRRSRRGQGGRADLQGEHVLGRDDVLGYLRVNDHELDEMAA